jgi:hypothetical protein
VVAVVAVVARLVVVAVGAGDWRAVEAAAATVVAVAVIVVDDPDE